MEMHLSDGLAVTASALADSRVGTIYQLCDFIPEYGGSFVDSLIELDRAVRAELMLKTVAVFPRAAQHRSWVAGLRQAGIDCQFAERDEMQSVLAQGAGHPLLVHAHFSRYDFAALAIKLRSRGRTRVVWHVHSLAARNWKQSLRDLIKARWLSSHFVDAVVAVGPAVATDLKQRGYPGDKVRLVPNGVATERFERSRQATPGQLLAWPNAGRPDCVYFLLGWEPARKGVDLFVKAAAALPQTDRHRSGFVVIGRQATREYLAALPDRQELGDRLQVVEPVADLASLMPELDVLVSASRHEAFGYAIAESLAAGKLVICSDIEGARELFGQAPGLWFFRLDEPGALERCLHEVRKLPADRRAALGQANSDWAQTLFGLRAWAARVMGIYRGLLGNSVPEAVR